MLDDARERSEQRRRLLAARTELPDREAREQSLQARVAQYLEQAAVTSLAFYWPFRGEPDLRGTIGDWLAHDAHRLAALPIVDGDVLEFHAWAPDAPMRVADFGIAVPAHGRVVEPGYLLIPCVGFDHAKHRLGYGAGFYDRTLATRRPRPVAIGIAFESARVESIKPHSNDRALDVVITDTAVY